MLLYFFNLLYVIIQSLFSNNTLYPFLDSLPTDIRFVASSGTNNTSVNCTLFIEFLTIKPPFYKYIRSIKYLSMPVIGGVRVFLFTVHVNSVSKNMFEL